MYEAAGTKEQGTGHPQKGPFSTEKASPFTERSNYVWEGENKAFYVIGGKFQSCKKRSKR